VEKHSHLITGFEIKLIRFKSHAGVFFDRMFCGDTYEDFLNFCVFFFYIMGVVCGNKADSEFPRKLYDIRIRTFLLRQTVILNFKEIIIRPEQIFIP
jgi:hypothetical protein